MTTAEWIQLGVVALTTGGSAYLSVRATLVAVTTEMKYLRRDVDQGNKRLDWHAELITDLQKRLPNGNKET